MKRRREYSLTTVALLLIAAASPIFLRPTTYAEAKSLIITEIKIRNDTVGLDEYIEIFNPTDDMVDLNEYTIGYINTPAPSSNQALDSYSIGDGLLESRQSIVLAKNELDASLPNSQKSPFSSLADSGGTVRIMDQYGITIDQFSWSSTQTIAIYPIQYLCTASNATCNQNKSQSFNRQIDTDENYVLANPTWQLGVPSPESSVLLPVVVPDIEPEPDPEENQTPSELPEVTSSESLPPETSNLLPPQITELLPNPGSPVSDSTGEFVELYNPNNQEFDLIDYRLETGSTFTYKFTFGHTILQPLEYKSFYITETGLILSNSSGRARLVDSLGAVVSQTNPYDSADDDLAWALIDGTWQWTTTPTPGAANVLTVSPLKVASAKTAAKKSTKSAAKKKTSAAKTKAKKPAAAAAQRQVYQDPAQTAASLHPGVLAGVGLLTIVYAAYEYRHDISNKIHQLRRYRATRLTSGR